MGLSKVKWLTSNSIMAPAQNTIRPAWATWAPSRRPDRLIRRALPDHQAYPVESRSLPPVAPRPGLESVTTGQNLFREDEVFVRLVSRCHPGTQTFIQKDVLGVEGLEFGIFCSADFLGHEVIGTQVEDQADDADGAGPQAHHRHEQHEEVQPALVGEGDTEDLAPEAVGSDHRIGLFFLCGFERLEGVGLFAVLKQGVFHRGAVNGAEQCAAKNAGDAHHVEGIQGPVVEALEEEKEAEDRSHTEGGREEPAALAEGVHQEDTDEHRNRAGEGDGVVRADADETCNLELTQHEADQSEGTVQGDESPEASELTPANKITLGFRAPEQQEAVTHRISGGGHSSGQEVATFQVRRSDAVGVPGGDKGGACEPATDGQIGRWKEKNAGPADKNEAVALEPVIEDVEPSPLRRASYSDRHEKGAS